MFKKTVIAAALATVTGSALADVSVSGRVEQGFSDENGSTTGWAGFTDNQLNISVSEDLGNGMTAFAKIGIKEANTQLDEKVGLTGGFGTIQAGRFEDFTEGVMAASQSTMGTNEGELGGNAVRTSHGVAYVSPTVNGFHVGVGAYATGTAASLSGSSNFDAVDVIAVYSNGPLTLMASHETVDKNIADGSSSTAGTDDQKIASFAVKYSMGDLSVAALHMSHDNEDGTATNDTDDTMIRLDYKMGANKITLQHASDDQSGSTADVDTTVIELSHALSKRTAVYIGAADSDSASKDNTYFGIQHTF